MNTAGCDGWPTQLLFFMTPEYDLTTFLSTHLGLATYPPYRVWRTRPVFPDRAAFVAYEATRRQADAVDAALEQDDKATAWELVQPLLRDLDGLVARAAAEAEAGRPPFSADDVSVESACAAHHQLHQRRSLETSASSPHATTRRDDPGQPDSCKSTRAFTAAIPAPDSTSVASAFTSPAASTNVSTNAANVFRSSVEGSEGVIGDDEAARRAPPPSFFGRFRAEYWEARIHTRAVDLLEQRRRYWEAVLLLRWLLCRPAVYPSKRGHWWFRLSVVRSLALPSGSPRSRDISTKVGVDSALRNEL